MALRIESTCLAWHHGSARLIHPFARSVPCQPVPASEPLHMIFPLSEHPPRRPPPQSLHGSLSRSPLRDYLFGRHFLSTLGEMFLTPYPGPILFHPEYFKSICLVVFFILLFQHLSAIKRMLGPQGQSQHLSWSSQHLPVH